MRLVHHRNTSLGSWIARRARRSPDRTALVYGARSFTYRRLDQRITRLARFMLDRGIGRGDRVAILGTNHPAHLESFFACGLIGAIWVPIHPHVSLKTHLGILRQARCSALVFTPDLAPRLDQLRSKLVMPLCVCTDDGENALQYEAELGRASDDPIDECIGLDDPAVLAFTSGTTDDNKGVLLSHENLAFNVFNLLSAVDYLSSDVFLATAPLYRMGGFGFVLPVLFKGGTCLLAADRSPDAVLGLLERHRATLMFDTPAVADALLRAPASARTDLSSLRSFVCGGDALDPDVAQGWLRRGISLVQGYGLTEASPVVLLLDPVDAETRVGTVGRPPLLCSIRIVDDRLEDVPAGRVGELLVHGPNVMDRYWHRPDATAKAITEDGWLRTGDAARHDERGYVTIVGRVSDRIELAPGQSFYPQVVEDLLRSHCGVSQCAVALDPDTSSLTAFVVASGDLVPSELIAHARARLPPQLVPMRVRVVPHLPRNPNGKLLRHRLGREASRSHRALPSEFVGSGHQAQRGRQ